MIERIQEFIEDAQDVVSDAPLRFVLAAFVVGMVVGVVVA